MGMFHMAPPWKNHWFNHKRWSDFSQEVLIKTMLFEREKTGMRGNIYIKEAGCSIYMETGGKSAKKKWGRTEIREVQGKRMVRLCTKEGQNSS